jgi:hypothetical protein
MTILAGAEAAARVLGSINSHRITKKTVGYLLIADSLGSKSQSEGLIAAAPRFFLLRFGYFVSAQISPAEG